MMTIEQLIEYLNNTNKAVINKYGKQNQLFVCIEELGELQKELTKAGRGKESRSALYEEYADAIIVMIQIAQIFGINEDEVVKEIARKLDRTNKRMAEDI